MNLFICQLFWSFSQVFADSEPFTWILHAKTICKGYCPSVPSLDSITPSTGLQSYTVAHLSSADWYIQGSAPLPFSSTSTSRQTAKTELTGGTWLACRRLKETSGSRAEGQTGLSTDSCWWLTSSCALNYGCTKSSSSETVGPVAGHTAGTCWGF